ncbi:hypothetical protein AB0F17_18750 [Nonomuraea sp. NPDC026600]|uniref:hypothetical protein n=1 Tax=Nonomuraea sp. NPDC026600 TaxID=3155363 RepID=UPI0033C71BB7
MYRFPMAVVLAAGIGLTPPAQATTVRDAGWRIGYRSGPDTVVNDLAATGPSNAWAAGARSTKERDPRSGSFFTAPLIMRWNGQVWTEMRPKPSGPQGFPLRELSRIEASSPANVWVAGTAEGDRSVLSRWDGNRWRLMGWGRTTITDLDVTGADHTWVVGHDERSQGAFVKHFHRGRWTSLPAPAGLKEISVRSASDIWGLAPGTVTHWNGKTWQPVNLPAVTPPSAPTPAYGPVRPTFNEVLVTGRNEVWIAVGFQQGDWSQPGTVLLHQQAGTWRQIRLPGDVITALSGDGDGPVYAASTRQSITATPEGQDPYAYTTVSIDTLRLTGASLTRQNVTPVTTGFQWSNVTALPATGTALAAGYTWRPPQGSIILHDDGRGIPRR